MKKKFFTLAFRATKGLLLLVLLLQVRAVRAQTAEAQQLLINVEKLSQLKGILENMYEGYQVLQQGYHAVRDIAEGNFSLHKTFLDALLEVSPAVRKYHRVADIGKRQYALVQDYREAWRHFKYHPSFTSAEIEYIDGVYRQLIQKSLQSLDKLVLILTAGALRMADGERLAEIDKIDAEVKAQASFLKAFNASTEGLARQRAREAAELKQYKKWYSSPQ